MAAIVPMTVATSVATRPITIDVSIASWMPSTEFQLAQLSMVNPLQT